MGQALSDIHNTMNLLRAVHTLQKPVRAATLMYTLTLMAISTGKSPGMQNVRIVIQWPTTTQIIPPSIASLAISLDLLNPLVKMDTTCGGGQ